ncbi:Trafficking protein particle complex subunit 12 [Grifola frondosa]|uniref:Trafficking protein particle complex subunit 12 n=1 Tax=Grifola frondosa TaxID=5627 RepID=A0A1C7MBQ8_GRIFR|nr:Trafficking protein particle complex subunit 12 [Grifola frondosa]
MPSSPSKSSAASADTTQVKGVRKIVKNIRRSLHRVSHTHLRQEAAASAVHDQDGRLSVDVPQLSVEVKRHAPSTSTTSAISPASPRSPISPRSKASSDTFARSTAGSPKATGIDSDSEGSGSFHPETDWSPSSNGTASSLRSIGGHATSPLRAFTKEKVVHTPSQKSLDLTDSEEATVESGPPLSFSVLDMIPERPASTLVPETAQSPSQEDAMVSTPLAVEPPSIAIPSSFPVETVTESQSPRVELIPHEDMSPLRAPLEPSRSPDVVEHMDESVHPMGPRHLDTTDVESFIELESEVAQPESELAYAAESSPGRAESFLELADASQPSLSEVLPSQGSFLDLAAQLSSSEVSLERVPEPSPVVTASSAEETSGSQDGSSVHTETEPSPIAVVEQLPTVEELVTATPEPSRDSEVAEKLAVPEDVLIEAKPEPSREPVALEQSAALEVELVKAAVEPLRDLGVVEPSFGNGLVEEEPEPSREPVVVEQPTFEEKAAETLSEPASREPVAVEQPPLEIGSVEAEPAPSREPIVETVGESVNAGPEALADIALVEESIPLEEESTKLMIESCDTIISERPISPEVEVVTTEPEPPRAVEVVEPSIPLENELVEALPEHHYIPVVEQSTMRENEPVSAAPEPSHAPVVVEEAAVEDKSLKAEYQPLSELAVVGDELLKSEPEPSRDSLVVEGEPIVVEPELKAESSHSADEFEQAVPQSEETTSTLDSQFGAALQVEGEEQLAGPPSAAIEPEVPDAFLADEPEEVIKEEATALEEPHTGLSVEDTTESLAADEITLAGQPSPSSLKADLPADVNKAVPPPPTVESDEDEEETPELYLPGLTIPTMFLPIPNTDPLTTLLNKYISPEKRPARDVTGDWSRSDFHTLVMTGSWRALARMARDRIVDADPEDLNVIFSLWYVRLSSLARMRLFNQTSAECTNLFTVLNAVEPAASRQWLFDRIIPFELEVLHAKLKYWAGDHMGYLDALTALLRRCKTKARRAKSDAAGTAMWQERGARVCLIIASQLVEMKVGVHAGSYVCIMNILPPQDFSAAAKLLEPLCKQGGGGSSPALRSAVGRIYLQGGYTSMAAMHFSAVAGDPAADLVLKAMNTALLASADGDWQRATDELRRILAADPENYVAINNLSVTLLSQGNIQEAIDVLENALQSSPAAIVTAEPLLFNLSTLYELRSATGADKKRDLLIEVAKWAGDGLRTTCLKMPSN